MTELEILSWTFTLMAFVMPVLLLCQRKWYMALGASLVSLCMLMLFYVTNVKTAYAVEAEMHKPLIGLSINK